MRGFLDNYETSNQEADEESVQWATFIETWHGLLGEELITTAQLAERLEYGEGWSELRKALPDRLVEAYARKANSSFNTVLVGRSWHAGTLCFREAPA